MLVVFDALSDPDVVPTASGLLVDRVSAVLCPSLLLLLGARGIWTMDRRRARTRRS